jgi:hypothetical protein
MTDDSLQERMDLATMRLDHKIEMMAVTALARINYYPLTFKTEPINEVPLITTLLKRQGYVHFGDLFTKGFVCIQLSSTKKGLTQIRVWVDIPNERNKVQVIDSSFLTGVVIAVNYYKHFSI